MIESLLLYCFCSAGNITILQSFVFVLLLPAKFKTNIFPTLVKEEILWINLWNIYMITWYFIFTILYYVSFIHLIMILKFSYLNIICTKKKKKIKIDIFSSKVRQNKTSLHIRNVDNSKKTSTLASRFS